MNFSKPKTIFNIIKKPKVFLLVFCLLIICTTLYAQTLTRDFNEKALKETFYTSNNFTEKINAAAQIINHFSGEGGEYDDTAQRWIYRVTELNNTKQNDTVSYYLQIWQTEIFYYSGLYQFGINAADKQIEIGLKLKDSFLIGSAYFFKAINLLELDSFHLTKINLDKALAYYPNHKPTISYKKLAYHNQLVNVFAENYFEQKQYDSALHYNKLALQEAYREKSLRGIPAGHLVQAKIFLSLKEKDSALFHLNKTIEYGLKNAHADLTLLGYGKQMILHQNNKAMAQKYLDSSLVLINAEIINNSFKVFFYKDAISVCNAYGDINNVQALQSKLLDIKEHDTKIGNELVQNITTQFVDNETKLLKFKITDAEKQKRLRTQQLVITLLLSITMLLIFLFVYRRNKTKYALLQQKSLIARELHDDVGASISSIGMYATAASQRLPADANAQAPLHSINETVSEISNNLKDIVWLILPENESFERLMDRIRQYAEPLCVEKNIHLTLNIAQHTKLNELSISIKKSIYLTIKEAINNALKHSNAHNITLKTFIENKLLQISIIDDGIGILKTATQGNGIMNMTSRINELGGEIKFKQELGTTIEIKIPLG
jgi:signal transduction histidine kinase